MLRRWETVQSITASSSAAVLDRLQWLLTRTGPQLSTRTLLALGLLGVLTVAAVLGVELKGSGYARKIAAATTMRDDMALLRAAREERRFPISDGDANETGLIGIYTSPITTDRGNLQQKLTSANPEVAAAIVGLLDQAKIGRGDVVAIGMTGSFPGLDLAVVDALTLAGAEVLEIASVGASNWGANEPLFTWLDMQRILIDAGRIHPRLLGASLGGGDDNGKTMTPRGREAALAAVTRNEIELLSPVSVRDGAAERLRRYRAAAGGRRIKLYINIGGNVSSIGPASQPQTLRTGLNRHPAPRSEQDSGVAYDFLRQGTPVLQLRDVVALARATSLPVAPTPLPRIGTGRVYRDQGLQTLLAWAALGLLVGAVGLARAGAFERLWQRLGWEEVAT